MNAMDVALICKALGDANRLEIVQMLSDGEKCGCKLLERFEITQPTLSHDEFSGNIVANSYLNCCICLKIKKYLMSLPHLPTSANFHQDIIWPMASAFNAQSDPDVVFKSFSASQQSMRSI